MKHTPRKYLHEEAGEKSLPDVQVVVLAGELGTRPSQGETIHDPGQLVSYIVRGLEGAVAYKVVVAPLSVLAI